MILRLTCPTCKKDSYSHSVEMFKPCPYCGIVFSGKYGIEKRNEYRIQKDMPVVFSREGAPLEADVLNCSRQGFCLKIAGSPGISAGDEVDCIISATNLKAEVKWYSTSHDNTHTFAGLHMRETNPDFQKL